MSLIDNALTGIRLAGKNLLEYVANPETAKSIGKRVALETVLGTGVQQAVPRMLGVAPPSIGQSVMNTALHSVMTHPISGGLQAVGMPKWAAETSGQILGTAGAHMIARGINPEPNEGMAPISQMNPELAQQMEMQRFQAGLEQQRYDNAIKLAYARNYSPPTTIIHKNPSAEHGSNMDMLRQIYNSSGKY